LHEALLILKEEGLEAAFARHRANHLLLKDGLEAIGLELLVEEAARLPQLNAVKVPEGVDESVVRKRLLNDFSIEIGAGLGELAGKIWRIGLMGAGSNPESVDRVVHALGACLDRKAG
jgi:alanine-glyoxylate transaminase / serine-glyoxylate transaminase / serine-pyruvate transaminase